MQQNYASSPPGNEAEAPSTIEMVESGVPQARRRLNLNWWYRISSPDEPLPSASLAVRESFRRGRLIAIALLGQICVVLLLLPTVGIFVNHALIPNLLVMLVVLGLATFFNKRGNVILAGLLAVAGLDLSLMLDVASYPYFSIFLLPMLDLLVLPELFAVSLLPAWTVFISMAIHIGFIISSLLFLFPQDAQTRALLHTAALQDALARPIVLQVLVAIISFLWVSSATQAIARAHRATSIAAFERTMAEQSQAEIEQKRVLEQSIQEIVQVHTQIANGNLDARVPINQGNVLWSIGVSLNTLLARLQRLRQDSLQLQKTNQAIALFLQAKEKGDDGPIAWQTTGTAVDSLALQHNLRMRSAQAAVSAESQARPFESPSHQQFNL